MLYTILPPTPDQNLTYLIPPFLTTGAVAQTLVLLATRNSTSVVSYSANTPMHEIAGTAIFYRPGLLISLIPEANFGACFVVTAIADFVNYAVIVVQKSAADGVRVGNDTISNPNWQDLQGTNYTSTSISLPSGKHVIWHSYSKMAVYFAGKNRTTIFGNPAPIISSTPDFRGCALIPEVLQVGQKADGWRESLKNCKENNLELISLSKRIFQKQVYAKLPQTNSTSNNSMQDVWIGMRRRSLNGEWYWLNGDSVIETNWDQNEPSGEDGGQCAIMSVVQGKEFRWRDEECCTDAHPICYKKPTLLPI
ncbi:macrophage mannose receptor 1 [Archocentrus centrarchus]|uniref:macrophage mannose receptor 1 n=1 Tax=Archocentrus centrarchus TaxID=63155 RepID=UPI0011E9D342|nr:macrophage mannose receptor 1-like [Archocentrus centrarchus]